MPVSNDSIVKPHFLQDSTIYEPYRTYLYKIVQKLSYILKIFLLGNNFQKIQSTLLQKKLKLNKKCLKNTFLKPLISRLNSNFSNQNFMFLFFTFCFDNLHHGRALVPIVDLTDYSKKLHRV